MSKSDDQRLSRRERQIMDIVHARQRVTAAEVRERLPEAPSYSAVRAMLAKLEAKGHLCHEQDGPRYVFRAVQGRSSAQKRALSRLLAVFFDDSPGKAVSALLNVAEQLSDEELDEIERAIERAKERRK